MVLVFKNLVYKGDLKDYILFIYNELGIFCKFILPIVNN